MQIIFPLILNENYLINQLKEKITDNYTVEYINKNGKKALSVNLKYQNKDIDKVMDLIQKIITKTKINKCYAIFSIRNNNYKIYTITKNNIKLHKKIYIKIQIQVDKNTDVNMFNDFPFFIISTQNEEITLLDMYILNKNENIEILSNYFYQKKIKIKAIIDEDESIDIQNKIHLTVKNYQLQEHELEEIFNEFEKSIKRRKESM